jgi:purine-cytosine permease-like protein
MVAGLSLSMGLSVLIIGLLFIVGWAFGARAHGWANAIGMCVIGIVLLFATLHLARGIGRLQGLYPGIRGCHARSPEAPLTRVAQR